MVERVHRLARVALDLADLPAISARADVASQLRATADRLQSGIFNVAVLGEFKRGKSSLINALTGRPLLPVGVVPVTAIGTELRYGPEITVTVRFVDGSDRIVPLASLPDFVTEHGNPHNVRGVGKVVLTVPSEWLAQGIRLIDTPGVGSVLAHNTEATHALLGEMDAALFVLTSDAPIGQSEADFLKLTADYVGKFIFVLNKTDRLSPDECTQAVTYTERMLAELLHQDVPVVPVSATMGLTARVTQNADDWTASGIGHLEAALRHLISTERQDEAIHSARRTIGRIASQARAQLSLALSAACLHADARRQAYAGLEALIRRVTVEHRRVDTVLQAEMHHLVLSHVLARLAGQVTAALPHLHEDLTAYGTDLSHLPKSQWDQALGHWLHTHVRMTAETWRMQAEHDLQTATQEVATRYAQDMNRLVAQVWQQVLAILPGESPRFELPVVSLPLSTFRLKTTEDVEILLDIGLRWFRRSLPVGMALPLVMRAAHRRLDELTDRHHGRLSHALREQVARMARSVRRLFGQDLTHLMATMDQVLADLAAEPVTADMATIHDLQAQLAAIECLGNQAMTI